MKQQNRSNSNLFSAILVLAFAARIPFLFFGYGVEEDSYGTVVAAHNSYLTGVLEVSRLPGHPFQEIILSFFYPISSPLFFNLLSCIASLFAVYFFGKICKKYSQSFYWLAALVFAFVPVVFIASVSTIDYMWAMAFAMASWYGVQKKQMVWAGVLFGLAIACRINIAVVIVPFVMIEYLEEQKINYKSWFFFLIVSTLTSLVFFIPVIHQYGWQFFSYSDQFPYPNFPKIVYKSSIGVWGILGVLAILFYSFFTFCKNKRADVVIVVFIVLQAIIYLQLPQKSAYLIPTIPFVIWWFLQGLEAKKFTKLSLILILSAFFCGVNLADTKRGSSSLFKTLELEIKGQTIFFDLFSGPVYADYSKRVNKQVYVNQVLAKTNNLNSPTAIISGWWYNQLLVDTYHKAINPNVHFVFYCNQDSLRRMQQNGSQIFYLAEQEIYNNQMFNMQNTPLMAKSFDDWQPR
ncbi:MAG: hypothetical protein WCO37_05720 [Bacteroidota bacterium]